MICRSKTPGAMRCYSPLACAGWGYCRQRNIDAGGMKNVWPEDQAKWKIEDNPVKNES